MQTSTIVIILIIVIIIIIVICASKNSNKQSNDKLTKNKLTKEEFNESWKILEDWLISLDHNHNFQNSIYNDVIALTGTISPSEENKQAWTKKFELIVGTRLVELLKNHDTNAELTDKLKATFNESQISTILKVFNEFVNEKFAQKYQTLANQ